MAKANLQSADANDKTTSGEQLDMDFKQGTTSRRRRRAIARLGLLACAIAVAAVAVASASDQRATDVLTGTAKTTSGKAYYDLTVKVKSKHQIQKIIAIRHLTGASAGKRCLTPDTFSFKTVKIQKDGTFKAHTSGYKFHANIDGKFKSSKKAHGHLTACTPGLKYTVKK
jgi:hypothetical protein